MRLKATISYSGLHLLCKGLLPTLEKFSKHCVLLATPTTLHFIQRSIDTDGMQESLFERYDCSSKHNCHIGIDVDASQLLRVLRAAQQSGETLELKLHQLGGRSAGGGPAADGASASKPFLNLACRGQTLNMQQDIPIASPLRPSELDVLMADVEASRTSTCGYFLDIRPELPRLQAVIDKMKSISSSLTVATTSAGDLHLQVESGGVRIACELRSLLPEGGSSGTPLTASTAEGRLQEARLNGAASTVTVQTKHFQRSVQSSLVAMHESVSCGIDSHMGYVQFMSTLDAANVSINIKLPVQAD